MVNVFTLILFQYNSLHFLAVSERLVQEFIMKICNYNSPSGQKECVQSSILFLKCN